MSGRERIDEILRLIDDVLDDGGAERRAEVSAPVPPFAWPALTPASMSR